FRRFSNSSKSLRVRPFLSMRTAYENETLVSIYYAKNLSLYYAKFSKIRETYIKMYEDMGQQGSVYLELRKSQIAEEGDRFIDMGVRECDAVKWVIDQQRKLWAETTYVGQKMAEAVKNSESSMATVFQGWMDGSKNFKDGFDGIMKGIVDSVNQSVSQMIAAWVRYQLMMKVLGALPGGLGQMFQSLAGTNPMAATTKHSGGRVGDPGVSRSVDSRVFADAKRYHGGGVISRLGPREVPIIANENEIISQPGSGGVTNFNFHIRALDAPSVAQLLMKNKHVLASAITAAKVRNDPSRHGG
ncbi:MAG: hypothetical protein NTZ17_11615, partial [Phycisphaerae bacterium]|nr:hypothetical protein [Phycisphaerae bacterium]